jgi:tetratricopeptide (TPR) repeat protein
MKKPATPAAAAATTPDQLLSSAWQAFTEGRLAVAAKQCATLLKAIPGHAHGWHMRALVALAQDKPKQALDYLAHVKDTPELLPSVAQTKGRAYLRLGQTDAALACFQEALGYQADDATSHYYLAMTLLAQGDAATARTYFRRATLLNPQLGAAHYEIGVLALAAGEAPQAVAAFTNAAKNMPTVAAVFNNLGLAQQSVNDTLAAEASFRQALALDERYAEAWYNLGGLLHAQGDSAGADKARTAALRLKPALGALQAP